MMATVPNQIGGATKMTPMGRPQSAPSKTRLGKNPSARVAGAPVSTLISATNATHATQQQKRVPHATGIQVDSADDNYVALDPATIPLVRDIPLIPPSGYLPQIWRHETLLGYVDPVYEALSEETGAVIESLNQAPISNTGNRSLARSCLDLAKDLMGVDASAFRIDDRGGEFGIISDTYSIRYEFMWYQFGKGENKEEKATPKVVGPYGVTSLASRIQKPKVSELTLHIKSITEGRGRTAPPRTNGVLPQSHSGARVEVSTNQPPVNDLPKSAESGRDENSLVTDSKPSAWQDGKGR
ncbi:hypothetical protein MHU86_9742 [Fragilaria crotonensis]|nr:hypothetical protein MHU86_9742 [Fragilaria crotonensis]